MWVGELAEAVVLVGDSNQQLIQPADQPAGPTLARVTTAGPSDVHT